MTPLTALQLEEHAGHDVVEVRFDRFDLQIMAQETQAADEMIDVIGGFGHAAKGVLAEFRVVKMHGQVLQHQIEGRSRVLQVVDEESGHGLKGLQFLGLQQLLGKLGVEQAGRDLVADTPEQIEILEREEDAADTVAQDDDAQPVAAGPQGDANAAAAGAEAGRVEAAQGRGPLLAGGFDVNRVGLAVQGLNDRQRLLLLRPEAVAGSRGEGGRGGEEEVFALIVHQPHCHRQNLEDVGNQGDGGLAEVLLVDAGADALGEGALQTER